MAGERGFKPENAWVGHQSYKLSLQIWMAMAARVQFGNGAKKYRYCRVLAQIVVSPNSCIQVKFSLLAQGA